LFEQRVTITGRSWVVWYASARRSEPAFEAEYGEDGRGVSVSLNAPSRIEP